MIDCSVVEHELLSLHAPQARSKEEAHLKTKLAMSLSRSHKAARKVDNPSESPIRQSRRKFFDTEPEEKGVRK